MNHDWKVAAVITQDHGPRYVIQADDGFEAVETILFNGFKLGFSGRAEVEYTELEIEDEAYPRGRTARFSQPDEDDQ